MVADENYLPLWLELHAENDSWLFELRAGEDRAVVVGSHPNSDVRVAHEGVAATHFHFEREGDGVVIVPGYRAALLVDGLPAPEPATIAKQAHLEFRGVTLDVTVHDVPPLHMLLEARHGTERMMRRPDYIAALPNDSDPTVVGLEVVAERAAVAALERPRAGQTDDELDLMTTTAWRAASEPMPLGPQGTVIMRLPPQAERSTPAGKPPSLPPIAPTERLRLEPWTASVHSAAEASPTRVEVPHPHSQPLASVRERAVSLPPPAAQQPLQPSGVAARSTSPSLAPTARAVSHTNGRPSVLARLGRAATEHPLRVAFAALPVSAVVALALVGVARLTNATPARASAAVVSITLQQSASQPSGPSPSNEAPADAMPSPSGSIAASPRVMASPSTTATSDPPTTLKSSRPTGPQPRRPPSKVQQEARGQKHVFLNE